MVLLAFMLPWQTYQSYLSVRSRIRDVINLTYIWRHRGDTVSFMSTIHPKYSTEMHQNTTFYAELNGEHAGEGFMPLRSIVLEIWTRKAKKSRNFRKFDLWPGITGSNIDLRPKIIPPIASTRRAQFAGLFREALRRFVWKRQGGSHQPPPPTPAKVAKHRLRARVKRWIIIWNWVFIVLCTSGIKGFVYQRAEGKLINWIFNATSAYNSFSNDTCFRVIVI